MKTWSKMNKTKAVKLHLEEFGSITSWEAIKEYGATRLSAIIHNLRHNYDMKIQSVYIEFIDRYETKSSYVKYIYIEEENKKNE